MHINHRHNKAKELKQKNASTQITHKIIWEKVIRLSRAGVEHYTYKPLTATDLNNQCNHTS